MYNSWRAALPYSLRRINTFDASEGSAVAAVAAVAAQQAAPGCTGNRSTVCSQHYPRGSILYGSHPRSAFLVVPVEPHIIAEGAENA